MSEDAKRIIDLYRRHAPAWALARGDGLQEQVWLDRFLAQIAQRRRCWNWDAAQASGG